MARRGPNSDAGKAVVRYNAVRRGALSASPLVPGLEQAEDWEAHRAGVLASFAPVGYLEETLAERIVQILWRLQRVVCYEQECTAVAQEGFEDDLKTERQLKTWDGRTPNECEEALGRLDAAMAERDQVAEQLLTLPDDGTVPGRFAFHLLHELVKLAKVDIDVVNLPDLPRVWLWERSTG